MSSTQSSTYAGVGTAYVRDETELSDTTDSDGFHIHGVAIGVGDVTKGKSEIKKYWPAEELRKAAKTLVDQPLVRDHINNTIGRVGTVIHAEFVKGVGIIYEAVIAPHYEDLVEDIRSGMMEVSIRAYHRPVEELDIHEPTGAVIVENIKFDNLSVVNDGAAPSNTANAGSIDTTPVSPGTASASAVVSEDTAIATLSRTAPTDKETVVEAFENTDEELSVTVEDSPTEGEPVAEDDELSAPDGIYTADGTWFAIAPDEHDDESTEWPDDAKYPLSSCTGDHSIDAAWRLRSHGDYTISQETLEARIRRAAESMECDMSIVGKEEASNSGHATDCECAYCQSKQIVAESSTCTECGDDGVATMPEEELAGYEFQPAQYEETSEDGSFVAPTLDDWGFDDWDDLDETEREVVAEHFLISASGFPPESFDDLYCSVVDADGVLHLEALDAEYEKLIGDETYTDEVDEKALEWVIKTADEEFGVSLEAEMEYDGEEKDEEEYSSPTVSVATDLTSTDLSQSAPATNHITETMIEYESADAEELSEDLDNPVVVEQDELEDMANKAEKADTVEEELEQLSDKLDDEAEASEIVEELEDEDVDLIKSDTESTVVEAGKAEMYGEVTDIYAEELAEYSPFDAEELSDRFSPIELKDRVEDHDEASLSSSIESTEPEPDAGDVESEELSEDDGEDVEDVRERYAEELESKGWNTQAEKVRSGELNVVDE